MLDAEKYQKIFEPYSQRFREIGILYLSSYVSKSFLKFSQKTMKKQYFYEEKLLFKIEKKLAKWAYKDKKKAEIKVRKQKQKSGFMERLRSMFSKLGKRSKKEEQAPITQDTALNATKAVEPTAPPIQDTNSTAKK